MVHDSEVHAYIYILKELVEKKGWDKDQIYTQNEIQNNPLIKQQLDRKTPENVVEISPNQFYVIEAKNKQIKLNQALKDARDYYADKINENKQIKALFITGIAGNDKEGYVCTSQFLHNGIWKTITENETEATALLSKNEVEQILQNNNPNLEDVEISEQEFLKAAEEINGLLHENAIHKDARARFISAILLALSKKTNIDLSQDPVELVGVINTRVNAVLKKENKPDFSRFIHIDLPSSEDNHVKLKTAVVRSIQILRELNVSAMMQSGKDLLGQFYEVFLKYGNGAKDIGIVLTPRHITRFAAEVLDIKQNDVVLDPTCGTGGFLVAAFDEVKKKTGGKGKDFDNFKEFGLYGIEEQDPVLALALVNMIFRGDGKNNMIEGNCFSKWLNLTDIGGETAAEYLNKNNDNRVPPITKVLMNPPFPKKKADIKEYKFIEHALEQMEDDGLLFSVLPYGTMIKDGGHKTWRENLLKKNTLYCVVSFPPELFSPVTAGIRTVGVFIKKGVPHKDQKVLWVRAYHDGLKLKKGKRLPNPNEPNDLEKFKTILKEFLKDQHTPVKNIPKFQKLSSIDFHDKQLELVPEAYLDQKKLNLEETQRGMDELIRETVAYIIRSKNESVVKNE